MFETLISLFERLVIAHEKLAASQEAILRVTDVRVVEDPVETPKAEEPKGKGRGKKAEPKPEAPKAEEPKPVEKPKATLADVKAAVSKYADTRLQNGSQDPKGDARALMAHHGGGAKKTDEIAEEYWADVVEACKSGWEPLPAKDEEL